MSTTTDSAENKKIYSALHDQIIDKRLHSTSPIRRYAHQTQYQAFVDLIPPGATVIDAGCGEGILCVMLAKKGCTVLGVDLSEPNIVASHKYAKEHGVADRVTFVVGDAEHLPAADKSFDYAISSHVLEHLPDFQLGAKELNRVAKKQVIAAVPTCLNLASLVLLGNDKYWVIARRTPYAWLVGFFRIFFALIMGKEGVNETYAGRPELIHIHRFPWKGAKRLRKAGLHVLRYRASSYPIPYFSSLVPFSKLVTSLCWLPFFRNFGYGTTYVCRAHAISAHQTR